MHLYAQYSRVMYLSLGELAPELLRHVLDHRVRRGALTIDARVVVEGQDPAGQRPTQHMQALRDGIHLAAQYSSKF